MIGMSPGASWETKRWPAERFGALASRAADLGFQVVVVGSASEYELGRQVRAVEPRAFDLTGRLPLRQLGGFIARCQAFAANDSGPMHMARALGVPTLALFGSTPPQFDFTGHEVITSTARCSPCSFYGRPICPLGHFECMMEIRVEAAWKSMERLIAAGPRPYLRA